MTDVTQDTFRAVTVHADKQGMSAKSGVQWLLEKNMLSSYPIAEITEDNEIQVFICGEDGFRQIYNDILAAQKSLDLVCWGFDPGMPLIRDGSAWNKQQAYGELLKFKASQNVTIRLLVWFSDERSSAKQNNLVGYSSGSFKFPSSYYPEPKAATGDQPLSPQDQRWNYCVHWWNEVLSGLHPNITVHFRGGDPEAVKQSLAQDEDPVDNKTSEYAGFIDSEKSLLTKYATHHQKPVLIDWGHHDEQGDYAVGYIMGLNSISDFWDRQAHLFDDPQREPDWDGSSHTSLYDANGNPLSREPYQDYAARLRGRVLQGVHDNFELGWGIGQTRSARTLYRKRVDTIHAPTVGTTPQKPFTKPEDPCQLQVLRTMPPTGPDKSSKTAHAYATPPDKSIKAAYAHATRQSQDYIYIEQQYFYYERWAREFLKNRQDYTQGVQSAGWDKAQHPILHLFVVIPWPEDKGMVPRTYDMFKMLGDGSSTMPAQETTTNEDLQNTHWWHANSPLTQDAKALPQTTTDKRDGTLQAVTVDPRQIESVQTPLGVKALFCRLVTYNAQGVKGVRYQGTDINKDQIKANSNLQDTEVMYRQIYIHSKLMLADDQWLTLGSANLNLRSMAVDSELNVGCAHPPTVQDLRTRVWTLMTNGYMDSIGGSGTQTEVAKAFKSWEKLGKLNSGYMDLKAAPESGFIVSFKDKRQSSFRHG